MRSPTPAGAKANRTTHIRQLEDARSQLKEVQRLIEAIEPGIPSMASGGEAGATPSV